MGKLESINAEEYPHLREAVRVIIQALESPEVASQRPVAALVG
jgi:hypothetical protein